MTGGNEQLKEFTQWKKKNFYAEITECTIYREMVHLAEGNRRRPALD